MARETTDAVATPNPKETLTTSITTGKVNPIAANSLVPNLETKKVSTRLKTTIESSPKTMGIVNETSLGATGPWVRLFRWFIICLLSILPKIPDLLR